MRGCSMYSIGPSWLIVRHQWRHFIAAAFLRLRSLVSVIAFLLTLVFATPTLAECPPFPDVQWWKGLSHDSVSKYVAAKHGGDWNAYIDKWEKQLKKIEDIYSKGSVITVSKDKIKLRGKHLLAYIENIKMRLAVIRCLAGISVPEQVVSPPPEKAKAVARNDAAVGGATAKSERCNRCHGVSGMSNHPTIPHLAGQNDLYLVKQIMEFQTPSRKDGSSSGTIERHHRIVSARVKNLSDAEIWNLAAFYSSRSCGPKGSQTAPVKELPSIALSCVKCHGLMGKSVFPEVPNLAGQRKHYLVKQLTAFRDTADDKGSLGPDRRYHYVMAEQARNLTDTEIDELTTYFSGLSCR